MRLSPQRILSFSDKVERFLGRDAVDAASLVAERHAVALVGDADNLGPERGADELRTGLVRDGLEELGDGRAVLGVQVGVDLIEDDHGTALGLLQGENEADGAKTCAREARVSKSLK